MDDTPLKLIPIPANLGDEVYDAVAELRRQAELWGEQNHPLIGADYEAQRSLIVASYKNEALRQKYETNLSAKNGTIGWDEILLEEVFELVSEEDPDNQYTEAVQVAAVALNIAGSIRRRQAKGADSAA